MTASEKFTFWKDWLVEQEARTDFNTTQKNLLSEMRNKLVEDYFETTINANKADWKYIFVPDFLARASVSFTNAEITEIFYNYGKPAPTPVAEGCNCNKGSLFGCGGSCKDSKCEGQPDDCGFMWAWECNGICDLTDF